MNAPPSQFAAPITRALEFMRQGLWTQAEQVVAQILARDRAEPDGLQLMGLVRAQQGRIAEAETLYRRSLSLRPRQANVQINLAQLLAGTGRAAEAIALLRGAVRGEPGNPDLLQMLAQLQQGAGDVVFAERNFRAALKLRPGDPSLTLGLGGLLNTTERPGEAEPLLRAMLATADLTPGMRAALEHNLAVSLKMQRRYDEALAQFDAAIARAPDLPLAAVNRAGVLQHLGRQDEALAGYREGLKRNPAHLIAHEELNALLYRMGRDEEFLKSYDAAPAMPDLLASKGRFLNRIERYDEATDCFEQAVRARPENPGLYYGLALARGGLKQFDKAVAAYETALKLRPDDVPTQVNLAGVLLQAGEGSRALELAERAAAKAPTDQAALAILEQALRVNRDERADVLTNYEKHIQIFDLDPPDGFADMATFNAALNAHLDALHGDSREHFDQTLRRGTQTMDPLFDGDHPLVAALRRRIEEAVAAYIARMDDGPSHPLSSRRSSGFRFPGSWSSRLRDQGFHTNHIHPAGWISSCYYVEVPSAADDEIAQQGWIKFGEPSFSTGLNISVRRAVKPVPGRLVLFPSYMWHGTVPFRSPTARTTIAFDAVPI